jgi:hypothetical protein
MRNRMNWSAEENTGWNTNVRGAWVVVTLGGTVVKDGFDTKEAAEAYIGAEVAKRDRRNAKSRERHAAMSDLGMKRGRNGSYE